jgi:hypothetical protein
LRNAGLNAKDARMAQPATDLTSPRRLDPLSGWFLVFLSWLVPGAGFFALGQYARAFVLFVLVQTPFVFGVLLFGSVPLPAWAPGDYGFNIVNTLTFVIQMCNGLLSGIWLIGNVSGAQFFQGVESSPYFDLASFYIMVSGAANYFAFWNFYDRHVGPRPSQSE